MSTARMLGAALAALLLCAPARAGAGKLEGQVVKIKVTYQGYDPSRPWAKKPPRSRSGYGVVVAGNAVLTSAELVADATMIRLNKRGRARRHPARVVHRDPEINLARIVVDEPGFFADLSAARLARRLPTKGEVRSARWRKRQLEVAAGRVARIAVEGTPTGTLKHAFLFVTTDLSDGGDSEPVFKDGRLVGLTVRQADKEARVLPVEVIRAYLEASRKPERYPGFASLRFSWQINRDRALSAYLGLKGEPRGIVVTQVPWGSSACGGLEARDVVFSIDGHALDEEGYYRHPVYGRLLFHNIAIDGHLAGDTIQARVLRRGEERKVRLKLRTYPNGGRLVPGRRTDRAPPYLVAGGLVFRELDRDYLLTWGKGWRASANQRLVTYWDLERDAQTPDRRRLIILSQVLPDPYNIGYHDVRNLVLRRVNGRTVDSIADLEQAFRSPRDGVHRVEFLPSEDCSRLVLDAASFSEATTRILKSYNIPERYRGESERLPDLGPMCGEVRREAAHQ